MKYCITYIGILILSVIHICISIYIIGTGGGILYLYFYMAIIATGYIIVDAFLSWLLHIVRSIVELHEVHFFSDVLWFFTEFLICCVYITALPFDSTEWLLDSYVAFLPILIPKTCKLIYEINKE